MVTPVIVTNSPNAMPRTAPKRLLIEEFVPWRNRRIQSLRATHAWSRLHDLTRS